MNIACSMIEDTRSSRIRSPHFALERLILVALFFALPRPASAQVENRVATTEPQAQGSIDLQGHRGARGLLPENSIPSVLKALDFNVTTVELDVVITRDGGVLVSHEPWMSSLICRTPDGEPVRQSEERSFNIYEMDYDEISGFDCGSRGHRSFPSQVSTAVSKPLLRDVLRVADGYAHVRERAAPRYNIEIKSDPENDGIHHPPPDVFARRVYDVLADEGVLSRTSVQSFDPRSLRAIRAIDGSTTIALLVSNDEGFQANLKRLGFTPDVYSPSYGLVDESLMREADAAGIGVVPWTVNDRDEMERLLRLGVRGLITDYPDLGREVVDAHEHGGEHN